MKSSNVFVVTSDNGTWKQLALVLDGQIRWLELVPALWAGWNVVRQWDSEPADWPGMNAAAIIAWKRASHPAFVPASESETEFVLRRLAA